jgi:hypothetical protein
MSVLRVPALILALSTLVSCGGGGSASIGPSGATVGIALTDAPTSQYDEVLATITAIELIGNGTAVPIFSGSETVDLLKLGDYAELFTVAEDVPVGDYSKIRLRVAGLTLIDRDEAGNIIESIDADLVANGKLDLNPRGPFTLVAGETLVISLDFDVAKSLKITTTGNGRVIVRPVIFVDILPSGPLAKLARVHGTVDAVSGDGSFRLCQTALVVQGALDGDLAPGARCLRVSTDGATGIFGPDGLPQEAVPLPGDALTVVGRLRPLADGEADDNDGIDEPADDDRFGLLAFVIEAGPLGTFDRLRGTAASAVDPGTDRFDLDVDPAQGIVSDVPVATQLYPKSRIFSRRGDELSRSAIQTGRSLIADAVLALGAGPGGSALLRTPLVVIDLAPAPADLIGEVLSLDAVARTLLLATDSGDLCVDATTAEIFIVGQVGDRFETRRGSFGDLVIGQELTAFGSAGAGGCLAAITIIATE